MFALLGAAAVSARHAADPAGTLETIRSGVVVGLGHCADSPPFSSLDAHGRPAGCVSALCTSPVDDIADERASSRCTCGCGR